MRSVSTLPDSADFTGVDSGDLNPPASASDDNAAYLSIALNATSTGVFITKVEHAASEAPSLGKNVELLPMNETTWLADCSKKVTSFASLAKGWDTYHAEPPNAWSRYWAQSTIRYCKEINLKPTAVVPSAEGGIAVTFSSGANYADIEILNSKEILAVTSKPQEPSKVWQLSDSEREIRVALRRIQVFVTA